MSLGFFLFYKKRRIIIAMTTHLGTVESTLFVPMLGRIYASEHFPPISQRGLRLMRRKWMKRVGHADAQMYFCVDSAEMLASAISDNVKVLADESFYRHINKTGLKPSTKFNMTMSDRLRMVKMIHLQYR